MVVADETLNGGNRLPASFPPPSILSPSSQAILAVTPSTPLALYQFQWLDVLDDHGQWLEAQIMDVSASSVFVHYKGWKHKHDEWIARSDVSLRIAPLHTHTAPPAAAWRMSLSASPSSTLPTAIAVSECPYVCDALDPLDTWYQANVINVARPISSDTLYLIQYAGWDERFNEWINSDSYRLAPRGTFTASTAQSECKSDANNRATIICRSAAPAPHIRLLHSSASSSSSVTVTPTSSEETYFKTLLASQSMLIREQIADGNCLFRSVSFALYGHSDAHSIIRATCVHYMALEQTYYQSFITEPFADYIVRMSQDGTWADHCEIQALSEIYDRPIQIFAYSLQPLKTFNVRSRDKAPIKLSYHCQSHYNCIIGADSSQPLLAANVVGEVEERALIRTSRLSATRSRTQTHNATVTASPSTSDDADAELLLALSLSRQTNAASQSTKSSDFDQAIAQSLSDLRTRDEHLLEEAKNESLRAISDDDALQRAMNASVDDAMAVESASVQSAMTQSSLTALPAAVLRCVELGFSLDECISAYIIFADADGGLSAVTANMTEYMIAQRTTQ